MRVQECVPLRRWANLFEKRRDLSPTDKNYLVRIVDTLFNLPSYERTLLTNKYFNLNEGGSFNARVKSDQLFADELEKEIKEYRMDLQRAIKLFNEEWRTHYV